MKHQQIPETDSIEELARFWDTHDLTDFEDELEEVPKPVFQRRPENVVNIPLLNEEIDAVARIAKTEGRRLESLLHDWIVEKLSQARGH